MYGKFALTLAACGALAMPAQAEDQAATELEAVVVSAPVERTVSEIAKPATVLTGEELRLKAGSTIGETLKQEPGITSQSFGPGVGQPVIRGQSGPRVRVMSNSLGVGDVSQLSPDHANGVEPVLAERIEVLRGPSTLLYGSGAIGGIVNVIDNRIPESVPEKLLSPTFEQRYNSVSDETTSNLKLEGGKTGFAYHLDGFYRDRNNLHIGGPAIAENAARQSDAALEGVDLQNSFGVIPNTNARSKGGTVGMSLVGDAGFAGVSINYLGNNYGIPPDGTGGPNTRINLKQTRYDFKSELKNPVAFAEALRVRFGYIDYAHTELNGNVPATLFTNKSYESRLEVVHQPLGPLKGIMGLQTLSSDFGAASLEQPQALVPNSQIGSYGVFAIESFTLGPGLYELGLRGETSSVDPQRGPKRSYAPISASASGQWKIAEANTINFAVTRSQRAPQVQELFSHGVHDATHSFEFGEPNLKTETSYNLYLGYRFQADWVSAELNLFQNWVNDYIFQQQTGGVFNEDLGEFQARCSSPGACFPVVKSRQADATFKGFEGNVKVPLMENRYGVVDLTLFGDFTRGEFVAGGNVPRMPPLRYGFQLAYAHGEHWSANLRLTRGEKQDHPGANDTATNGYALLDLNLQYQVAGLKDTRILVFAMGHNLLNDNIRNSTSYLRNFAPEPGRGAEIGLRVSY